MFLIPFTRCAIYASPSNSRPLPQPHYMWLLCLLCFFRLFFFFYNFLFSMLYNFLLKTEWNIRNNNIIFISHFWKLWSQALLFVGGCLLTVPWVGFFSLYTHTHIPRIHVSEFLLRMRASFILAWSSCSAIILSYWHL